MSKPNGTSALLQWMEQQEGNVKRLQIVMRLLIVSVPHNDAIRAALLSNMKQIFEWDEEGTSRLSSTERTSLEDLRSLIEDIWGEEK